MNPVLIRLAVPLLILALGTAIALDTAPAAAQSTPQPLPSCSPIPGLNASPPPAMATAPPGTSAMTPQAQAAMLAGLFAAAKNGIPTPGPGSLTPAQLAAMSKAAALLCPPGPAASATPASSGSFAAAIYAAAQQFYGTNTSALFGAAGGWGTEACMLSVNAILKQATGQYLDNDTGYVPNGVAALNGGMGVEISQSQAQPGDIAVASGEGHIGICMNVGCTLVLSNSSSNGTFTWQSNANFAPSYSGPSTFYEVTG